MTTSAPHAPHATTASQREAASERARLEHARQVRSMFGNIAGRYDLLNHVFSANTDVRWRRLVARTLADVLRRPDAVVLDVACGTGDLAIALEQQANDSGARIIASDFCRPMLDIAQTKSSTIPFIEGDALHLPFLDETFDAVTIGFGLRNLASVSEGLREFRRILKPCGRLAVLEFSKPVIPGFSQLFNFYFKKILPRIGDAFNGSCGAYLYLSDSVQKFPNQRELENMMRQAGFRNVTHRNLTGGIAALHLGTKE